MTQRPDDTSFPPLTPAEAPAVWPAQLKTSGFAIASLVLGAVGLISCCLFLPSILGLVFGAVALSLIRRGEAVGRGLALAGLILSILGMLLGAGVWTTLVLSPTNKPVTAAEVSGKDRKTLETMKVLRPGEPIDLFCPTGMFSIREGGVVLTEKRLIVYSSAGPVRAFNLDEIEGIDYTPSTGWLDEGNFIVNREGGEVMSFTIDGMEKGDAVFHRALGRRVAQLRNAAGKPPSTNTSTRPESD